jgi:hypothetical protein
MINTKLEFLLIISNWFIYEIYGELIIIEMKKSPNKGLF